MSGDTPIPVGVILRRPRRSADTFGIMRFPLFARAMLLMAATALFVRQDHVASDTWWALRAGHDMWTNHTILMRETYSYTAYSAEWPNHEWLWEILAWVLFGIGGLAALSVVNTALAVGALMLARTRHATTTLTAFMLAPAALLELSEVSVRPQVATLFCLSFMVWLICRERYWPLAPLTLLWANLHGGVTLGISVVGCAVIVSAWRAFIHGERRRACVVGIVSVGCVGATLATPLGTGLWTYVRASVALSKRNDIGEWRTALHLAPDTCLFWATALALAVAVVVRRRRINDWSSQFLMVSTGAMFLESVVAVRNIPCYALVALPLGMCLFHRPTVLGAVRDEHPVPHGVGWAVSFGLLVAAAAIGTYATDAAALGWKPMSPGVRAAVSACPGHMYNTFNSGGELIWWAPQTPVFVDNRQDPYAKAILDLGLLGSPGRSTKYRATFTRFNIECAAFTKGDRVVRSVLGADGWSSAYKDSQWMVMTAPGVRLRSARR